MPALVAPQALEAVLHACLDYSSPMGVSQYAADILRKKAFSKYTEGTIPVDAENRALDKFLKHCLYIKNFVIEPKRLVDEIYLDNFSYRMWKLFYGINPDNLSPISLHQRGGVGPGASIAAHGTDFLRKFYYGPVSASSVDVLHLYFRGCASNPLDLVAAKRSSEVFGCFVDNCSRVSFVEKNVDEARTIATEPSVNMFFQLAVGSVIDEQLHRVYGFSKSHTPERNRDLARIGSVDGSFATIDLQSASDSISLSLCEKFLPSYIMELLRLLRCDYSRLPDGRFIRLPMVSTMGNGWTFSLMTAIIYCALHSACDVAGDSRLIKLCSVFGDDIVCPSSIYRHVVHMLELLGFVVNAGKSFCSGDFRESCGHDFYRGRFVRPVFIRRLNTSDSLYVAANRLLEWGAFHSIDVNDAVLFLLKPLYRRVIYVPLHEGFSAGLRVPSNLVTSKLTNFGSWRYSRYEAKPLTYDVSDEPKRPRTLSPSVNPDGVFVSLLGGYLRNGKITERSEKKVQWRLASNRITPGWDYRSAAPCPGWDMEAERRWKLACFLLDDALRRNGARIS